MLLFYDWLNRSQWAAALMRCTRLQPICSVHNTFRAGCVKCQQRCKTHPTELMQLMYVILHTTNFLPFCSFRCRKRHFSLRFDLDQDVACVAVCDICELETFLTLLFTHFASQRRTALIQRLGKRRTQAGDKQDSVSNQISDFLAEFAEKKKGTLIECYRTLRYTQQHLVCPVLHLAHCIIGSCSCVLSASL